jgi:hypothetical protein
VSPRRRLNPWRLYPYHQGAAALAWAEAGNVAVVWNDVADPRDDRVTPTRGATIFAKDEAHLIEAVKVVCRLLLRPRKHIRHDPIPHALLSGMPLARAVARCKGTLTRRPA